VGGGVTTGFTGATFPDGTVLEGFGVNRALKSEAPVSEDDPDAVEVVGVVEVFEVVDTVGWERTGFGSKTGDVVGLKAEAT